MKKLEIGLVQEENLELQKQLQNQLEENQSVQKLQEQKIHALTKMFSVSTIHQEEIFNAKVVAEKIAPLLWCL